MFAAQLDPFHGDYALERIAALERLDEYRRDTSKRLQRYQAKMAHYYNKHISPRSFAPGTLVLCNTREVRADLPRPKFAPSWEGPYVIYEDVGNGCYDLQTIDGEYASRVNAKFQKLWHDHNGGGHPLH